MPGRRAHQPFQRKTPLSPVFGSILLLHSTECHHDHKDYDELATLERQLAHMNDSGVLMGTTNWNGCFAAVHLAMTGMVYPCPDSALIGSPVPP